MNILYLSCSWRGSGSESDRLSQAVVERLLKIYPDATLSARSLVENPIPHIDHAFADALVSLENIVSDVGSLALSDELIHALRAATHIVIGTPVHNYTVPSVLKAWVDHVVRAGHTFIPTLDGKVGLLEDRPVYIALASAGFFTERPDRQPDFIRPYLSAVFETMGITDLHFLAIEGTVFGEAAIAASTSAAMALLDEFLPLEASEAA